MTRDPDRIPEVLDALDQYWVRHPDLRLGQILENMAAIYANNQKLFYIEDDVIAYGLKQSTN